jgi:hypothetical protein
LVLIAAFPAVEIEVAVLAGFRLSPAPFLRPMLCDPDRGQAVWPDRIGVPNSWVRSMDGLEGSPAGTILVDAQSMAGSEMSFEHLATPAAFEANDMIALNRSPDRHGGGPLSLNFGCRFSAPRERLMDGRD